MMLALPLFTVIALSLLMTTEGRPSGFEKPRPGKRGTDGYTRGERLLAGWLSYIAKAVDYLAYKKCFENNAYERCAKEFKLTPVLN